MENKIGAYLRQHREAKHLTLEEVAAQTGIREHYLADLENGDFTKIPGDVFIRGFLRNYGNYLGLDGNGLVEAYRTGSEPEKILKKIPNAQAAVSGKAEKQETAKPAAAKKPETGKPVPAQKADIPTEEKKEVLREMEPLHKENSKKEEKQDLEATKVMPLPFKKNAAPDKKPEPEKKPAPAAQKNTAAPAVKPDKKPAEPVKTETAKAPAAAAASPKKEKKVQSWLDSVKKFLDDKLYETVPDDGEGDGNPPPVVPEEPEDGEEENGKPAFSFKVFAAVFVGCLAIFTGVMAYFVFGGKSREEVKPTTAITDVKSDHSSEKKVAEEKKPDPPKKEEKKKEEPKPKPTNKTLGLGSALTVEISYKKPVWTQTEVDGKTVEAAVIPEGSTRTYKGDDTISVNLGSVRDVVIKVDGKEVPYGEKEWGVVTRVFHAK